jgi:hypothetical protein
MSGETKSVSDIADEELLRRCVSTMVGRRGRTPAWARISVAFGLGSTYSMQLCRRFGRDPETGEEIKR